MYKETFSQSKQESANTKEKVAHLADRAFTLQGEHKRVTQQGSPEVMQEVQAGSKRGKPGASQQNEMVARTSPSFALSLFIEICGRRCQFIKEAVN